jgi:hypothetical protein
MRKNSFIIASIFGTLLFEYASAGLLPFTDQFDGDVTQSDRDPVQWSPGANSTGTIDSQGGNLILENSGGFLGAFAFEASPLNPNREYFIEDVSLRTQLREWSEGALLHGR